MNEMKKFDDSDASAAAVSDVKTCVNRTSPGSVYSV